MSVGRRGRRRRRGEEESEEEPGGAGGDALKDSGSERANTGITAMSETNPTIFPSNPSGVVPGIAVRVWVCWPETADAGETWVTALL